MVQIHIMNVFCEIKYDYKILFLKNVTRFKHQHLNFLGDQKCVSGSSLLTHWPFNYNSVFGKDIKITKIDHLSLKYYT